jgi:hypothetical protein
VKRFRLAFASAAAVAFAAVCSPAVADVLVRSCDTAGASCSKWAWVTPADAKAVQVQRTGTPFVTLADVQQTERIASCYDDAAVAAGSSTACSTRVPGRTDLWQLKSVLYTDATAGAKALDLTVDASNPRWEGVRQGGRAVFAEELPSLGVRLYGAPEGQPLTLLDSSPWAAAVSFRRESQMPERWCFAASLTFARIVGTVSEESAQSAPWCGAFGDPAPVLHLAPPNSITGKVPTQ